MTKKEELIKYVIDNGFITKPSLQEKFKELIEETINEAEIQPSCLGDGISSFSSQTTITMEILIFENTPFREIPEQDNPYYDKEDTTECLIISRVPDYVPTFEVSHISKEKNLTVLGVFFHNVKYAQIFVDAVSQNGL